VARLLQEEIRMSKRIAALSLLFIFTTTLYSQNSSTQKKELTEKVNTLYQQGKLAEAIKIAESLVKLEKDSTDTVSHVNALINLARLKRAYYVALQNRLAQNQVDPTERRETSETADKNAGDAEALFREALQLNETSGKGETTQTADIKSDLAWLVYHHISSETKTIEKSRSRIDEAEKLFLDSIALNEQTRGKDDDATLSVVRDTGDFYYYYVNFEKALPFYERYIQTSGQKGGPSHPDLVPALRPYANILFTTFQDGEATAVIKRIETITQRKEGLPAGNLNLHLRSKDSVAFGAALFQRFNKESEELRNKLKAEGKTLDRNNISAMPRMIIVPVRVEVDETGKITQAAAQTNDPALRVKAESEIAKWSVRPFSYNGTTRKMRGILSYREIR
jgi:hypothetical protein